MELKWEINGRVFSICIGHKTVWFEQIPYLMLVEEWYGEDRCVEHAEVIYEMEAF